MLNLWKWFFQKKCPNKCTNDSSMDQQVICKHHLIDVINQHCTLPTVRCFVSTKDMIFKETLHAESEDPSSLFSIVASCRPDHCGLADTIQVSLTNSRGDIPHTLLLSGKLKISGKFIYGLDYLHLMFISDKYAIELKRIPVSFVSKLSEDVEKLYQSKLLQIKRINLNSYFPDALSEIVLDYCKLDRFLAVNCEIFNCSFIQYWNDADV